MSSASSATNAPGRVRFGLFEFDLRSGELRREGDAVKLAPQPARLLTLLLSRPGELVLRDELRAHIWGADTFVDFERGLNFCVLQIRTALGDSSDNPRFVQTIPRKGYRFIAPVSAVNATVATADAPSRRAEPQSHSTLPGPERPVRHRRALAVATVAGLTILAAAGWAVMTRPASTTNPSAPARVRVAVLPFVNLTGDATANDLADGLTDDVISQLGRLGTDRVAVIARTSAMAYRSTTKTVAEIGRELKADFVVESSVRRDNGGLRLTSNLVPAADESPVASWSETFGRSPAIGDSESAAAVRLARLIALELAPDGDVATVPPGTSVTAAWAALMRGRAAINRGTPEDVRHAIREFESAVQEGSVAPAWAHLAAARHLLVMMGGLRPNDAYPPAADAAARALAIDARLPEAHLADGLVKLWYDRDPGQAAAAFERAIALNPSDAAARHDYAWALVAQGRDDEAIAQITAARDLDPISTRANNDVGWLYLHLRRPADAIRACEHTLAIDAGSLEAQACLERAYVQRGMYDAALQAARAAAGVAAASGGADDADAQAQLTRLWQQRLARLEQAAKSRWVSPYTLATLHVMAGDSNRAFDYLERAVDERVGMLTFIGRDPAVDPLRPQPRFQALLARLAPAAR